jgi:hypothetical protein
MTNLKKTKFFFKQKIGRLLFFKRHSNLFLVLLDSTHKHVITLTSGSCKLGKTKKQKISAYGLSKMITVLLKYLNKYKIKYIKFLIRQKLTSHFYNIQKLLKLNNKFIKDYKFILKRPHSIIRGRKKRRI